MACQKDTEQALKLPITFALKILGFCNGLYLAYNSARMGSLVVTGTKLLIALRPEDIALTKGILNNEFDVVFCHTFEDACAKLDDSVKLLACGVHFDNGRVFDFLRYVRGNRRTENFPFFIMLGTGGRYSPAIVAGIKAAAQLLKVTGFTDLTRLADKIGQEETFAALRQGIRDALAQQGKQPVNRPSSI